MYPSTTRTDTFQERTRHIISNFLYAQLHQFIATCCDDILPAEIDLASSTHALDVACGCGDWISTLAYRYPHIFFTGIDSDPQRISYARAYTQAQRLTNTHFIQGDMYRLYACLNTFYDLVHARFLAAETAPRAWRRLVPALVSVCRRGGWLVWTEAAYPTTNGPACQRWCELHRVATRHAGHTVDVTSHMDRLLKVAGCQGVQRVVTDIDLSYGTHAHRMLSMQVWNTLGFAMHFLVTMGVLPPNELESLREEIMQELAGENFNGHWELVTVVGNMK